MTLMRPQLATGGDRDDHCEGKVGCITCGDSAEEMVVLRLDAARGLALCEAPDGTHASVETALVEPVGCGDRLLVHAGTALQRLQGATR
jgi:hypothetical protein